MEQTGLTRSQVRQGLKAGLQQVQTVVDAQRVVQGGAPPPPPPKLEFGETKLETSKGQINTAPAANTQQQAPGGTTNLVLVACRGNLNGSYATKHLYGPAT